MKFPPPLRFLVPLLLLVLGLTATWLDYELNLANDLERNLNDVAAQADTAGARLTTLTQHHLERGELEPLRASFVEWKNEPWLRMAAAVDEKGVILASTDETWNGRAASESAVAPAWAKTTPRGRDKVLEAVSGQSGDVFVLGAFPVRPKTGGHPWLLLVFDRADATADAQQDAWRQMAWVASVIAFFCLCLWAVLHFGVAERLGRLARSVRDFGEGQSEGIETIGGADEVHELSAAFSDMGKRLTDREQERLKLEREVIDSVENERRRIGHELHDGIGQQLTAALMAMNGLQDELRARAPALVERAQLLSGQLGDAITEVRSLSHGLAPVPLWERGLEHALQSLADSTARSSGIRCVFECPEPITVPSEATAGSLYRIAQEAVNNALKHAEAGEVRIGLERRGDRIVLEVDDDGNGLPEDLPDGGGIGFRVMRHRAAMLGGQLELGTPPAGGTRVAAHIPVTA